MHSICHRLAMNDIAIRFDQNRANAVQHERLSVHGKGDDVTGLAEFNRRAGVAHGAHGMKRSVVVARSLPERYAAARASAAARSAQSPRRSAAYGENNYLRSAALEVVEALHHGERTGLEAGMSSGYDVLEQHILLRSARDLVDEQALPDEEQTRLRDQLNEMLADLMDEHGDVIRAGLRDAQAFEAALGALTASGRDGSQPREAGAMQELIGMYGPGRNAKSDTPFTPLGLMQSLQDHFGSENVGSALAELRSTLAADLRARAATGPRLWLSLADAACFNMMQSSLAIASDLRRSLFERAKIIPRTNEITTAMALLSVAESTAGSADELVSQILERKGLAMLQLAQMYLAVRQAVERLALKAWGLENLARRQVLLDELMELAFEAGSRIPATQTPEASLESRLREEAGRVRRHG